MRSKSVAQSCVCRAAFRFAMFRNLQAPPPYRIDLAGRSRSPQRSRTAATAPTLWRVNGVSRDNFVLIERRRGGDDVQLGPVFQDRARFPNICASSTGTLVVLGTVGTKRERRVMATRSADRGATWQAPVPLSDGINGGGLLHDARTGDFIAFVESSHPPARKMVFRSVDDGLSWQHLEATFLPDSRGNLPDLHMNESGITLSSGRLIRAARFYAGQNYGLGGSKSQWPEHYVNAIYSDDHGLTWHTSDPVPGFGFGEAAIVERIDGTLLMNIRRHWAPRGTPKEHRFCRWSSKSADGGHTWSTPEPVLALPDGPSGSTYGLMGGLAACGSRLFFSNVVTATSERRNGHLWVSVDEGRTWPTRVQITDAPFAYSSLAVHADSLYLLFEGGPKQHRQLFFRRFDVV